MSEVQSFRGDGFPRPDDSIGSDLVSQLDGRFDTRLRLIRSPGERAPASQTAPSLPDWSGLVDLVHAAAHRLRRTEAQAQDQDRTFGQALRRARDEVVTAERQARQAETLADSVHQRAEARIAAAEARAAAAEVQAQAAEARADAAEAWLGRVQATILAEFPDSNARAAA